MQKTLLDINLCNHPNSEICEYYMHLTYKAQGADLELPYGYPACPCDHCIYLNRDEDFFTPRLERS